MLTTEVTGSTEKNEIKNSGVVVVFIFFLRDLCALCGSSCCRLADAAITPAVMDTDMVENVERAYYEFPSAFD